MEIDAAGKMWNNVPVPWDEWKPVVFGRKPENAHDIRGIAARAREKGHDGVIVSNVVDPVFDGDKTSSTVYVAFDPERIQILERLAALGLGGQMVKDMLAKARSAAQPTPATLPAVTVTKSPTQRERQMNSPYGYQDYSRRTGSVSPADATRLHESRESPDLEVREDDEGNEEGADPLTLAVMRLLMERGGR